MESPPYEYPLAWITLTLNPWMAGTIVNWCTNNPIDMPPDMPAQFRQHKLIDKLDEADPRRANTAFTIAKSFIDMQENPRPSPGTSAIDI